MTFADWEWKKVKALRQWVRDFNKLAEAYGFEDAAGTPDEPDQYYVESFEYGLTPQQAIAECFGDTPPAR